MDGLRALWSRLACPDDYERHKSHTAVLNDLAGVDNSSSDVMEETMAAFNHVEVELGNFCDDFANP